MSAPVMLANNKAINEANGNTEQAALEGEQIESIDELLSKSKLLADFKAVKNGNVWCTGKNLFQETTGLGTMIEDIHTMLTTDDDSLDELTYMHKLK